MFINTGSIFSWDCIYSTLFFIPLILWQQIHALCGFGCSCWVKKEYLIQYKAYVYVYPCVWFVLITGAYVLDCAYELQCFGRSKCACMHNLSNWLVLKYIVDKTCGFDEETMKNQLLCFYIHAPHCTFNMFSLLKFWYTYCTVSAKEVCQK